MNQSSWHSYPKIYNLGHVAIARLFDVPSVLVQEKVDGSQFSFGKFGDVVKVRSKGQELILDAPEKMFAAGVDVVKQLAPMLKDGWTYRGEYLQKPKHNALAYDRIPCNHVILFDINDGEESYLPYGEVAAEAARLGLEVVPRLYEGPITGASQLQVMLDTVSVLGGQKIEGVVIKRYDLFGKDGKCLFGKHVSEAFKEVHKGEWKKDNPTTGDVLTLLGDSYRTPARWNKAIQHLRERGALEQSPKDIGALIHEVQNDIVVECEREIKDKLWQWASKHVLRASVRGLPEWYKDELMKLQFEGGNGGAS